MTYSGFDVTYITYPDPPRGWVDGVYYERERAEGEANFLTYRCRHFREREETGWGVYDYCEGVWFSFRSNIFDCEVKAALRSHSGDCSISAYCNGVRVMSSAALKDGETTELSFRIYSCVDISEVCFSPDTAEGSDEAEVMLEVVSLSYEVLPERRAGRKPTLFLASDSTVQTYDPYYYPQTGWGEVLYKFFRGSDFVREYRPEGSTYSQCRTYELPDIRIENRSIGGRSSRSFILEGKLAELLSRATVGDYIMIQFGHNDCTKARPNRYVSPDDYEIWVRRYLRAAYSRGIMPILVTPVMQRNCGESGEFTPSFPEFDEKLKGLALDFETPLIDLGGASLEICRALGAEACKKLYLWAEPGEYEGAYEKGVSDNTHLSRTGALVYAGEVARMLSELQDKRLEKLSALIDLKRMRFIREALDVGI